MKNGASICLVTPGHLSSTPRIVKAADALAAAGHRVHVVAGAHYAPAEPLDAAILASAQWTTTRVRYLDGVAGALRRLRRRLARRRLALGPAPLALAARAQHAGVAALVRAAARVQAPFYFGGGGVAGLAATAMAARRTGASYGFDAEDWHEGESEFVLADPAERAAVHAVLHALLPDARVVTCAAPLIGEAFGAIRRQPPVCVLNVFPLAQAPAAPVAPAAVSADRPAVLYWFSQTIGPGRGLEAVIDTMGRMRVPAELHLRGFVDDDYRRRLLAHAATAGARPPVFLPPASADAMVRLAAGAHLGLSLEQTQPPNRDLCLTNKIFTYVLAGLPQLLTPTRAQRALAPELGEAALLLAGDPGLDAATIDTWLGDPKRQAPARDRAWTLGRTRFNWDREQTILLDALTPHLPGAR